MSPAIAPTAEMRRTSTSSRRERRGHLGDPQAMKGCLDDHFAREFHACRAQIELYDRILADSSKPSMEIVAGTAKEETADSSENRIAQVFVEARHSSLLDPARETIPHNQVVAVA